MPKKLTFFILFQQKRGVQLNITYIDDTRILMKYKLPLNEVVVDFFDKLKSISSGYARFVRDIYKVAFTFKIFDRLYEST